VGCLTSLLPSTILRRLARADGRRAQPVASCGVPAMAGDVAWLNRAGRLGEIAGLSPASIRDVGVCLAAHGLADVGDGDTSAAGCPVDCLGAFISGRVLNRLARADGRGVAVAPGGPPATVGDVVRRCRESRLGEIAGLSAQCQRDRSRPAGRAGARRQHPGTAAAACLPRCRIGPRHHSGRCQACGYAGQRELAAVRRWLRLSRAGMADG
jgi:hypothetical protein